MTSEPLLETLSTAKAHGGVQGVYRHLSSETKTEMTFAVFVPPHREGEKLPVLWYLSGLTCTHANCMEKGEYRRLAAVHGLILVLPDTSPRGENIPDEKYNWQFGQGAAFYLDATQAPYAENYRMYSYVLGELPGIIAANFPANMRRQGIMGHSMGGHGALMMALKNPQKFRSASAFAPIVKPTVANWSKAAFAKYLGPDEAAWREYDTCLLIEDGRRFPEFLVDQGTADSFLNTGLLPALLEQTAKKAHQNLLLNMREGYDHSYHFISSFMDDHLRWHATRLNRSAD